MNKTIAVCDGCGATLETGIIIRLDICATWRDCGAHENPLVRHLVEVTENPRSMVKCREVHFCNPECAKTFLTTALLDTTPITDNAYKEWDDKINTLKTADAYRAFERSMQELPKLIPDAVVSGLLQEITKAQSEVTP